MSFQRAWQTVGNHVVWHAQYFWTVFYCLLIKRCLGDIHLQFFRGRRNTLNVCMVWPTFAAVSSGDKMQVSWQAWYTRHVMKIDGSVSYLIQYKIGGNWKTHFLGYKMPKSEDVSYEMLGLSLIRGVLGSCCFVVHAGSLGTLLCVCGSFASFCATAWWSFKGKGTATCRPDALHSAFHTVHSSGWWFQPLWKILISWDDYSQYMAK